MRREGGAREPSARETRKRLALGAGFGLVSGGAAIVFSGWSPSAPCLDAMMALPALISSRSPAPRPPTGSETGPDTTERRPRLRLGNTAKAVLAAVVFAGLRLIGELDQAVEPVYAAGRALIIGALLGAVFWIARYANDRRKEERQGRPPT